MFEILDLAAWPMLALAALAVFSGALLQGSVGVGLGMIAAPILMLINPAFVPAPLLVLAILVSILIARREWRAIEWPGLTAALAGRIPGSILAGMTIAILPLTYFKLVFGGLILAAVALSGFGWRVITSKRNLFAAGLISGYMGTITSVGAPPMALAFQHSSAAVIRSTMSAFFIVGAAFSLGILAWFDRFSAHEMVISVVLMPALLAGFWVSNSVVKRINSQWARYAVLLVSGGSAGMLVIKGLLDLAG